MISLFTLVWLENLGFKNNLFSEKLVKLLGLR